MTKHDKAAILALMRPASLIRWPFAVLAKLSRPARREIIAAIARARRTP